MSQTNLISCFGLIADISGYFHKLNITILRRDDVTCIIDYVGMTRQHTCYHNHLNNKNDMPYTRGQLRRMYSYKHGISHFNRNYHTSTEKRDVKKLTGDSNSSAKSTRSRKKKHSYIEKAMSEKIKCISVSE